MKRTLPGLVVLLLALAACAAPAGSPAESDGASPDASSPPSRDAESGAIEHPTGSEPILVVSSAGGFVPVQFMATQLPSFVLLGDGRVIMQGAQTLEFPGPAYPALVERTLTEEGIQAVLATVEATNLFTADLELRGAQNIVADAADTLFTIDAGGQAVTVSIYGLGTLLPDMEPPPGVSSGEIEAHRILGQLNDGLMTLDSWLPADAWEPEGWQPFEPEAFRLYVRDVTNEPMEGGDMAPQLREWPTDDDPAAFGEEEEFFGDGTRCGVVDGDLGAAWLEELAAANQMTLWTDDGDRRFSVLARPVLPHEDPACPGFGGAA
ncbi:MAG TPA: hypothetical protein VF364_09755 [Candidatus Limnocylindria bacterium]